MNDESISDKMIVPVAMSFSGSAIRIWNITRTDHGVFKLVLVPIALTLIVGAWVIVSIWYFIMYVLFGVFFILYRFLRHGSRKRKQKRLNRQ